ncbi:MAG: hypothetical protein WBB67_11175 [bacterium]
MANNSIGDRKIYIIYIPIILIILLGFLYSQVPDTLWTKTYGGADDDWGYSVKQTTDGGFIIGGYTNSFGSDHGYLIKTDSNGDTLWTRTYSGLIASVLQTYDGGYIFVGTTGYVYAVVRTDSLGDTLWTRRFTPGDYSSRPEEIQPTFDSCYIIVGTAVDTMYPWDFFYNIFLAKIDDDGNTFWTKEYGSFYEFGYSVQQTCDSGYIVAGRWFIPSYLMKTDWLGDSLWLKSYPEGHLFSVRETSDGGFVSVGDISWPFDIFVIRTDYLGDTLWTKRFGESANDVGHCIRKTPDGGYVITGYTASFGAGGNDVYLLKIRDSGDTLWTRTYGGTESDIGYELEITSDSGYIIAGYTGSYGAGSKDVWLLKIAPDTFAVKEAKSNVITNHAFGASIIKGPLVLPENKNCKVFDITGRVVAPDKIQPGIYFIEIDGKITQKVVKVR